MSGTLNLKTHQHRRKRTWEDSLNDVMSTIAMDEPQLNRQTMVRPTISSINNNNTSSSSYIYISIIIFMIIIFAGPNLMFHSS